MNKNSKLNKARITIIVVIASILFIVLPLIGISYAIYSSNVPSAENQEKAKALQQTAEEFTSELSDPNIRKACGEPWFENSSNGRSVSYFTYYEVGVTDESERAMIIDELYLKVKANKQYTAIEQTAGNLYFSSVKTNKTTHNLAILSEFEARYAPANCGFDNASQDSAVIRLQVTDKQLNF